MMKTILRKVGFLGLFVALAGGAVSTSAQTYSFTTLAGAPRQAGSSDGAGSAARFHHAKRLAVDGDGNIFVTDAGFDETDPGNNTVRKITPAGVVTTLAGLTGSRGTANGTGAAARFNIPSGIAADDSGNVFVVDTYNGLVRKVTPAGVVTTVAGDIELGPFDYPSDIAIDRSGNLYVTDPYSYSGWRITPGRGVTELGGNFFTPAGIAVDSAGNVFVAHFSSQTITKMTPAGVVTTFAGEGAVRFGAIAGIAMDGADNLFVVDSRNNVIRKVTPAGLVTTVAGAIGVGGVVDGAGANAHFEALAAIAVDKAGNLYVADSDTIRKGVPAADTGPVAPAVPTRITNLSIRATAGVGADALIVGFSLAGAGVKPMLLRAVGPSLVPFGISGVLTDPTLRLDVLNGPLVAQNDNWENTTTVGGAGAISTAAMRVGAFPLMATSRDAALLETLSGGSYTAQLGGGSGTAMVEIYDAGAANGPKLVNVSARTRSGTGGDALIAGFFVEGDSSETLLIRGIGPALAQFGVAGALADPRLQLFRGSTPVAENNDWGSAGVAKLSSASAAAGAFALAPESKDAALLVTLTSGAYTVHLSGMEGTTGVALVEIYEVIP